MRREKKIWGIGLLLLCFFAAIAAFTFYDSNRKIEQGYLASEGSAAENFAALTASSIRLSNAQVEKLKGYNFAELQQSEENRALADLIDNDNFARKVDYAYVMIHLKGDDVKYQVTPENQDFYDAPLGTPLEVMWLLDVTLTEEGEAANISGSVSAEDDQQRYSYYIEEDAVIFGEAPTYLYNDSEWGAHICGYSPLYSTEGTYIGVVGVELQTDDFDAYRTDAMEALGLLLSASTLSLALLFFVFYTQYRRQQYQKIYTDSLTQVCNRSYYNDLFAKHMRALRRPGHEFVLMIADIDWFKKVNDTFGHAIGDEVLEELGGLLMERFGKKQVVRFGGEEFVVGLWVKDDAELLARLEGLYGEIRGRKFTRRQIDLTLSLGCSCYMADDLNGWLLSGMLGAADAKLYQAKENGRNQYLIEPYDPNKDYKKQKPN